MTGDRRCDRMCDALIRLSRTLRWREPFVDANRAIYFGRVYGGRRSAPLLLPLCLPPRRYPDWLTKTRQSALGLGREHAIHRIRPLVVGCGGAMPKAGLSRHSAC